MPEPQTEEKPYLSVTQLELFAKCPEAYRRRYMEGEKRPPGIAMIRGKAVHTAAESNMKQKKKSFQDMRPADVVEMADSAFKYELDKGGVSLNSEERSRGLTVVRLETQAQIARMARLHAVCQAPDYQPVAVEEAIRVTLPQSSRDLLCVIDLVDDRNRVVDFKSMGKSPSKSDADTSIQLTAYHLARQAQSGVPPATCRLDATVDGAETQKRVVLESPRTIEHVSALGARFVTTTRAIEAGSFPPAAVGCWWCARKWCGYFETCAFVRGQTSQGD